MKIKLSATVPVVQYGNLVPEVEVESKTFADGMAEAESYIREFWNKYVESGKELPNGNTERVKAFVGGEIDYDKVAHVYTWNGKVYQSGSQYADSFRKPFDKQKIASLMGAKVQAKPEDIIKMWELKGKASRNFGSAVHEALQLHEQYKALSESLGKTTHIHDNFILKDIVESYYKLHGEEKAVSEITVVDHAAERAGQIDRLVILGEKHGQVRDFKTGEVKDKLSIYFKQLEFYTEIMQAAGWKMDSPEIDSWNGKWEIHKL
jgi:hypothetical protein